MQNFIFCHSKPGKYTPPDAPKHGVFPIVCILNFNRKFIGYSRVGFINLLERQSWCVSIASECVVGLILLTSGFDAGEEGRSGFVSAALVTGEFGFG